MVDVWWALEFAPDSVAGQSLDHSDPTPRGQPQDVGGDVGEGDFGAAGGHAGVQALQGRRDQVVPLGVNTRAHLEGSGAAAVKTCNQSLNPDY